MNADASRHPNLDVIALGPNAVNLAVREPGDYTLRVRFADGTVQKKKITVGKIKHVSLTVNNGQ